MGRNDIIIVRIWEGLGNQMFQYAYARALKEKGFDVRLDMDNSYADFFKENAKHDVREVEIQYFHITLPKINAEKYGKYRYIQRDNMGYKLIYNMAKRGLWRYKFFDEFENQTENPLSYCRKKSDIKGGYYIKGWFQDEKYFKQIRDVLCKELTPKKKIVISKQLRQALSYEESVSLHVRRGDFIRIKNILNIDYYYQAITFIKNKYNNPLFLIFSDDLNWVKENLNFGMNCIYVNEDRKLQDYEELMLMSKCKSNIISNSTFSWWGAWLNSNPDKIVVAPMKQWYFVQRNIIPADWFMI